MGVQAEPQHPDGGLYKQLIDYRENRDNPPLLVVSDFERFEVHTNWTNTTKRVYKFTLQDLLQHKQTPTCPLPPTDVLKFLLTDPEQLRPDRVAEKGTRDAAKEFAAIAERLELERPHRLTAEGKEEVTRFLMRLLFCLFGDSIRLLPDSVFRKMIEDSRGRPRTFTPRLRGLFRSMATQGEYFGPHIIQWFNGGLFDDDAALELSTPDLPPSNLSYFTTASRQSRLFYSG